MGFEPHMVDTVYRLITENMEQVYADLPGLRYRGDDGRIVTVTFREFAQDIRRCVGYLNEKLGGAQRRRVCLLGKNSYRYAVAILGLLAADSIQIPLNPYKSWEELHYELSLVDPDVILWDDANDPWRDQLLAEWKDRLLPLQECTRAEPAELQETADPRALAMIMFTSGTTGRSKGVMLNQWSIMITGRDSICSWRVVVERARQMGYTDDRFQLNHFSTLPLFHIAAYANLLHWPLYGTATNMGDARSLYRDLADMPSESMAVVPSIAEMLRQDILRDRRDKLGPLWILMCSSAAFSRETLLDLRDHGILIIQNYGMTETGSGGLVNEAQDERHIATAGHTIPCMEYKLDQGELCMKGECLMLGYYKDPEAVAQAVDSEGWLHTGDLAKVDEDGYYTITGRKKNLIILDSGENVSPEELEGLLANCDAIRECVVKEKGKKICAVVFCQPEDQEKVRSYITRLNRTLPLYKRIGAVECSNVPLPRTAVGKLQRS